MSWTLVTGGFPAGLAELGTPDPNVSGDFIFDGPNRRIIVRDGITEIDVDDMWSRWADWRQVDNNSAFLLAIRSVGGDPVSATKDLGITYFLTNDWKVRPHEADHRLIVNGNLYTDPAGSSPFVDTLGEYNVLTEMQVSNLVDSTISQLAELEQLSFEGVVRVSQATGTPGTAYPAGSRLSPTTLFSSAVAIGISRNIRKIQVSGIYSTSIGEVVSGKTFVGINLNNDRIVTQAGTALVGCDYEDLWVTGPGSIGGTFQRCFVEDVPTLLGGAKDSGFLGTLGFYAALPNAFQFFDCHTTRSTNATATLNVNAAVNVLMHRCSGSWALTNVTGGVHVLNMAGAKVELDGSCTGGTVILRGDCTLVDGSAGTTVVDERLSSSLTPQQAADLAAVRKTTNLIPGLF